MPWSELGFEVVGTCTDGNAALSILRDRPVDVVLSDIRMPNMDGLELCRIARDEFPDLVVILLTAFKGFEYARRVVEIGAWRYLLKPTNFPALYA
ncbi:MAG: response regulator, partial [Spirochaetales bacterium]|nr:response regulator [Spirochaetales bacterium]